MTKQPISLRVEPDWLAIVDRAANLRGRDLGVPMTRTQFIELAALSYLESIEAKNDPDETEWPELTTAMMRVIHGDPDAKGVWNAEVDETWGPPTDTE